jgi:clan AA aspartic protease (TIGR02281 family)
VVFDADGSHEMWMLFDTGATYTTLSRDRLDRMGIPVPQDAPTIVLNTANGEVEAPIVLIERAWLGGFPVEGLTVAVCEDCRGDDHEGLLGLNVSGQFSVTLDPGRNEMLLKPAVGTDRTLDVAHWLDIGAMTYRYPDGRVEVEVEVGSETDRTISEAVVTIDCAGELFEAVVQDIPSLGESSARVALPRESGCEETLIQLKSANW